MKLVIPAPAGMARAARRLVAVLAAAWLSGCAVQTSALRASPPAGLPPRAELAATPFFPQTELQCGPAALATVLGAMGIRAAPERLADDVFLPARSGTLQAEMIAGARRHGAVATRLPGTLQAVLEEVARGRPVVVMQNLGLKIAPAWHYAVVVGYEVAAGDVLMRSGTVEREVMAMRTFEHTWARSGHWAFVVHAPADWPMAAEESAVVEAAVGYERIAPPAQSLVAYEQALLRWPQNLTLAMGVGNAAYATGDITRARQVFQEVAQRHGHAAAWINLARVSLALGDPRAAQAAALRAMADPAWAEPAQRALDEATAAQAGVRP